MEKTILGIMQRGLSYQTKDIAQETGISQQSVQPFLDILVRRKKLRRIIAGTARAGKRTLYRLREADSADIADHPRGTNRTYQSSLNVVEAMKPGIGYTSAELASLLSISVQRIHMWIPRLKSERQVAESTERHKDKLYYLAGTAPSSSSVTEAQTPGKRDQRIVNGSMSLLRDHSFESEYGQQLRQLAALSQSTRDTSRTP
ncbi:FaeA/PapI family transcriptional regulator [Paraburkholderia sediminicola]|uniref:FaeA/PapI family transcriptional regulator n=1 Tax=Paraburkholderia sediminicola TaxID=458836 RepID=UPI0038BB7946